MLLNADDSLVLLVDLQPRFLSAMAHADEILSRTKFLVECANLLDVPVLCTEHNLEKMGPTDPELAAMLKIPPFQKMEFSAAGCEEMMAKLDELKRPQVVICGIETHICVCQTAHDLMEEEYEVFLAMDAITSRDEARTKLGVKRMRDEGAVPVHTESAVYEWMKTADHPKFREVLAVVKQYA